MSHCEVLVLTLIDCIIAVISDTVNLRDIYSPAVRTDSTQLKLLQ